MIEADLHDQANVVRACQGASCVVSTLLGLDKVMLEAQGALLDAAVEAGVPRFIPSDYSMDFTKIHPGINRNFDLHRIFRERLERAPIRSTSILNGAFMNLLTGEAPLVLFKINRVLYWGSNPRSTPRLHHHGRHRRLHRGGRARSRRSAHPPLSRESRSVPLALSPQHPKLAAEPSASFAAGVWAGCDASARSSARLTSESESPFPVWQGMQYLYCMFEGSGMLTPLDNQRYPHLHWTKVHTILQTAV